MISNQKNNRFEKNNPKNKKQFLKKKIVFSNINFYFKITSFSSFSNNSSARTRPKVSNNRTKRDQFAGPFPGHDDLREGTGSPNGLRIHDAGQTVDQRKHQNHAPSTHTDRPTGNLWSDVYQIAVRFVTCRDQCLVARIGRIHAGEPRILKKKLHKNGQFKTILFKNVKKFNSKIWIYEKKKLKNWRFWKLSIKKI